eukprot:CAMPEP_0119155062 /NCGR_PEP_ID=MMETSP1310-20130426/51554_1 /TAXON_ID=464262 /ORGANISM="Genus nov. species nov., Strain RCC2339" /LENGTH=193 /DNA_ID=CAMNT_0007147649 /DNA_START=853 /DNA_END=1435 /DNA_ORIENTATION=+
MWERETRGEMSEAGDWEAGEQVLHEIGCGVRRIAQEVGASGECIGACHEVELSLPTWHPTSLSCPPRPSRSPHFHRAEKRVIGVMQAVEGEEQPEEDIIIGVPQNAGEGEGGNVDDEEKAAEEKNEEEENDDCGEEEQGDGEEHRTNQELGGVVRIGVQTGPARVDSFAAEEKELGVERREECPQQMEEENVR